MVAGSLFLSTQVANAAGTPYSASASTQTVYDQNGRPLEGLSNLFRYWNGVLPSEDRDLHIRTIFMVLNNADNGEIGEWWSRTSPNRGLVRVVYSYDAGNGYCRVFQSAVTAGSETRQYQETACMQFDKKAWQFYNK